MRKKIVAGNWKMNKNYNETKELVKSLKKSIKNLSLDNTRVIISPTFVSLKAAVKKTKQSKIEVAAQNMHQQSSGAFTGAISADMIKSVEVNTVIIGHSERRTVFNETDELLIEKVDTALENKLEVIFCVGEKLEDRKSNNHFNVVKEQLSKALFHLDASDFDNLVLAYEPVWAIGTGETATPEQAQEIHAFIRSLLEEKYSSKVAENISILYGGSVKPANAKEIFSKPDVDGGLIGGAALKAEDFTAIIKAI